MKLCRLIDWFKGPGSVSAMDYAALHDKVLELDGVIYDLGWELDRKEEVIRDLLKRARLAETMLIKYRRQRNQLRNNS